MTTQKLGVYGLLLIHICGFFLFLFLIQMMIMDLYFFPPISLFKSANGKEKSQDQLEEKAQQDYPLSLSISTIIRQKENPGPLARLSLFLSQVCVLFFYLSLFQQCYTPVYDEIFFLFEIFTQYIENLFM